MKNITKEQKMQGNTMGFSKKELDVFYHLLHSQVTSMNVKEIEDEIEMEGHIFSLKSMKDAQDLKTKIIKMMKGVA